MLNHKNILKSIYSYYPLLSDNDGDACSKRENLEKQKVKNSKKFPKIPLLHDIENIFKEYSLVDWTDSESCCYEFKILLHKYQDIIDDDTILMNVLNGERFDLRIFISILEPYYYMFIERTNNTEANDTWGFSTVECFNKEIDRLLKSIEEYFSKQGYRKLSDEEAKTKVPDIETELKEVSEVNVFDCLFTDLVKLN